ncbi:hypothetical protein SmJEL517_g00392 [Synchytrium microbalum]|uniref:DNA sliding clamp PCNA n=1 Tax=Synchytrium microbalum TaxID=1806994 RepID=A0A507CEV8_9FUNG|nr:uncharacterized protein SmJEL517_g00392 [Synchytrium microbalum]TPX38021.1 hypothetical protein SmJEL517_g00392 [Synchytrium microbalum]
MLEARLGQSAVFKKVLDSIKDLVSDANFDCNDNGINLQAMDNSHVALVILSLKAGMFDPFRCDRNLSIGINLASLGKIMKCAANDDVLTIKADDQQDTLSLTFENNNQDRVSEYELKLMDIDSEHLGIPETNYEASIKMSSTEFQRICRDLMQLSESVIIEATKESVKFTANGDIGNGNVTLKAGGGSADKEDDVPTEIELQSNVTLTFSLKYLVNFTKATSLSKAVTLSMSNEVPLLVEYKVSDEGHIRYYLAPKIGDDS